MKDMLKGFWLGTKIAVVFAALIMLITVTARGATSTISATKGYKQYECITATDEYLISQGFSPDMYHATGNYCQISNMDSVFYFLLCYQTGTIPVKVRNSRDNLHQITRKVDCPRPRT